MKRNRNCLFLLVFLPLLCFGEAPFWQNPILTKIVTPFRSWMEQGQGDHFVFLISETSWSDFVIVSDPDHYEIRDPSWFFYRHHVDEWILVRPSETPDAYFSTKRRPFYWLTESGVRRPVLYTRLDAAVDSNGVFRTWAEYERGIDDIVVTNELLQAFAVDTNGIPHIDTLPGQFIPRLWSNSFQCLERMNFDIYEGTNLVHRKYFSVNEAPVAPELSAAEKTAFAQWFRSCAATNAVPATNAVLAVFADDDLDGRMDAFAALDAPPDADGARRWSFCRNMEDGWLFHGLESPASVVATTNEFFRFANKYGPSYSPHAIVAIRPNPEAPLFPFLPRNSDEPYPVPDGWRPIGRNFLASYEELLFLFGFVSLERLPVESIP